MPKKMLPVTAVPAMALAVVAVAHCMGLHVPMLTLSPGVGYAQEAAQDGEYNGQSAPQDTSADQGADTATDVPEGPGPEADEGAGTDRGVSNQPDAEGAVEPEREDIVEVLGDDLEPPALAESIGAVVMDQGGTILFQKNPDLELPMASTTKIMTAMVALDEGPDLDEVVTLQEVDLPWDSQAAYYGDGDKVTFGELLRVMLVYSANDAAYNVAIITSGSQEAFAERMNAKAQELGMEHSHFINPHGLEDVGHYSCARDLAVMGRYAMENYPVIAQDVQQLSATTTVRGEQAVFATTDRLLGSFRGMRGVKTGAVANNLTFVGASGRGNVQLYSAVLGCLTNDGRFGDTASMMEWAYGNYSKKDLVYDTWPVRLQTSAYDLGRKSVISARSPFAGDIWKGEGSLSYKGVLCKANRVVEPGAGCGWISWRQGERPMGGAGFAAREVPERVSAWPLFSMPLFYDTAHLGELAEPTVDR